jgi:hypothetical protein
MKLLALIIVVVVLGGSAASADIKRVGTWSVDPNFEKSPEAREALSGAACVKGTNHCLVVNDEKKYAQFFDIVGNKLVPGKVIRLLHNKINNVEMDEIDAEAVAYAPPKSAGELGYYYITGSHGRSRQNKLRDSVFFLFGLPVNPESGLPTFKFNDEDPPAPQIETTALLRTVIKNQPLLAPFAEQPLNKGGVTIEGLAVHGTDLLFGFRAPAEGGNAFVMRVALDKLFRKETPPANTQSVRLESGAGIRDMATVSTGLLILAGQSKDAADESKDPKVSPSIWFWDGRDASSRPLGILPGVSTGDKAETLLVLDEMESSYRVLVLFDGVENGGPIEYIVPK